MIPLRTTEIAALTGGAADVDAVVTGVASDSRAVRPGDLFVALAGDRAHGVVFLADAFARGAVAALVPEGTDGERLIRVADPLMALGRIAAASATARRPASSASPAPPARRRPRTSCGPWSSRMPPWSPAGRTRTTSWACR